MLNFTNTNATEQSIKEAQNADSIRQQLTESPELMEQAKAKFKTDDTEEAIQRAVNAYKVNTYIAGGSNKNYIDDFIATIKTEGTRNKPKIKTGFYGLNKAIGGSIKPAMYVMGGRSSVGKTTMFLQIADDIAKQGTDIIYFSYEQTQRELLAKSLSRESYIYCRNNNLDARLYAFTMGKINDAETVKDLKEKDLEVYHGAVEQYRQYAEHIYIAEGRQSGTAQAIYDAVSKHIATTGNTPVIFIDYLQAIPTEDSRADERRATDEKTAILYNITRESNTPVFILSSLNRSNYYGEITMEAFKESGRIEYDSDILMGIQLKSMLSINAETPREISNAKTIIRTEQKKAEREVSINILKHRNGGGMDTQIDFTYHAKYNYFECLTC